jgi:hypothetical protein
VVLKLTKRTKRNLRNFLLANNVNPATFYAAVYHPKNKKCLRRFNLIFVSGCTSVKLTLKFAIVWVDTPQGWDYWEAFYYKA